LPATTSSSPALKRPLNGLTATAAESLGLPEAKTGNFDRLNRQKKEAEEFANARIERYKVAQREAEQANKIAAANLP
jgi:hypothetical protein